MLMGPVRALKQNLAEVTAIYTCSAVTSIFMLLLKQMLTSNTAEAKVGVVFRFLIESTTVYSIKEGETPLFLFLKRSTNK
jgi:hypothetical protein